MITYFSRIGSMIGKVVADSLIGNDEKLLVAYTNQGTSVNLLVVATRRTL